MVFEEQVVSGVGKGANFFLLPTGKINLWITAVVFLILAGIGLVESFQQHSAYPFVERGLLPIIGADTSVGLMVDGLSVSPPPTYDGFLTKTFPAYLWFWLKFWFLILCNIWMIFFFCWLIYGFWYSMNSNLIARNVVFTIITFLIISLFIGMIMYNVRLSGLCLPDDRAKNFNHQMANVYPLSGVSKLVVRFVDKDFFYSIAGWSNTNFGKMVANIPNSPDLLNASINDTNVSI